MTAIHMWRKSSREQDWFTQTFNGNVLLYRFIVHFFFRTKHLIVDVIRVQAGDTLTEILETPATEEQVMIYMTLYETNPRGLFCTHMRKHPYQRRGIFACN